MIKLSEKLKQSSDPKIYYYYLHWLSWNKVYVLLDDDGNIVEADDKPHDDWVEVEI